MWIIGVDYHPSVQQIAFVNTDTGECGERRRSHSEGEAEKFYCELKAAGSRVRVGWKPPGMPAGSSGYWRNWASSCGFGDPAQSKAKRVRKQKTHRLDAALLLQLLVEDRFSSGVGTHSVANHLAQCGRFWISTAELKGKPWFRINPVNFRTREHHIEELLSC
jgi:hypothetical protein